MLHTGSMLINLKPDHGDQADVDGAPARARRRGRRRHALPAADAGPDDRRRDRADRVPRLARRRRHGDGDRSGSTSWSRELRSRARAAQRRPATPARPGLAAYVDIDRDTASRLAITASAVDDALYSAFGQRIVSTIFTETNQYRVILEAQPGLLGERRVARQAEPAHRLRPADAAVGVRHDHRAAGAAADHARRRSTRPATIGFDTAPGVSLGAAVDAIRAAAQDIGLPA